ncbi:MAG: MFS transporter [Thermomicrobiales bacterium]
MGRFVGADFLLSASPLQSLWGDRDFRHLWAAIVVSTYGTMLRGSAMIYAAIFVLHASPTAVGALRLAELIPGFVIGLLAGVWVDRARRRPLMMLADIVRAVALATIPLAAWLGVLSFAHLVLVAAVVSGLGVLFDVAYQAFLPSLVPNRQLVEANSKISAGASVTEALSFSSGGWLVQLVSAPFTLAIDALTFVASALFLGRVRDVEPPLEAGSPESTQTILHEVRAGIEAVLRQPYLRAITLAALLLNAGYGIFGVGMIYYLNQIVGFEPGALGLIFAVGGVSSFVGAMLAQRLSAARIGAVMVAAMLLTVVGQAFIPLAANVGLLAVALLVGQQLVTDAALTIYDINQVSLRQAITPDHLLGRVNACLRVTEFGGVLAGTLLATLVGGAIGLRATLWIAVSLTLLAAVALLASPLRNLRHIPAPLEVSPS